jgi:hypothetical protein
MRRTSPSWISRLAAGLLALGLIVCPPPPVSAQQDDAAAGEGGGEKGRPLDGYIATATLCGLALFVVAKSARR